MQNDNRNDPPLAVALEYDPESGAPRVVASGERLIAENIIKKARESGVPVYEDASLARSLSSVKIGEEIPPELYNVVAQVLLFVSDMDELMKKRADPGGAKPESP